MGKCAFGKTKEVEKGRGGGKKIERSETLF